MKFSAVVMIRLLWLAGFVLLVGAVVLGHDTIFAQPPIPHPLEGRDNCLACHETGAAGAPQVPEDHAGRTIDMCRMCHQPGAASQPSAPFIPHSLEGRETCTDCHQPQPAEAVLDAAAATPTAPPLPVPTAIVYPAVASSDDTCLDCHETLGESSEQIVNDWRSSVHAERNVACADCHGGDPSAQVASEAMSPAAGFIGKPAREDIPALCASCHADVTRMRQYNLPTDQYAKYHESVHGQRLLAGDMKVATCYDCHDGHATHEPNDPRAHVYSLNVPLLCASCHADAHYMAEYDIPTNQFELYQTSVHGVALLQEQNVRAPNCATCHGTHGAAPPGFAEVANVCGNCHEATQNYFVSGPHNSDDPNSPRCVTCHGRYDVGVPSEDMFIGAEDRHCGSCHAPDSEAGQVIASLRDTLASADEALNAADSAVADASSRGMIVTEEEQMLTEARTKLITARASQHTLDLARVTEDTDASRDLSARAQRQAEDAISESRFRREAMAVSVAVIGLVIGSLWMLRRELERLRRSRGQ